MGPGPGVRSEPYCEDLILSVVGVASAAAMRRKRLSRYSAYSAWSLSQRSLDSARNPALRASVSSSGDVESVGTCAVS